MTIQSQSYPCLGVDHSTQHLEPLATHLDHQHTLYPGTYDALYASPALSRTVARAVKRFHRHVFDQSAANLKTQWTKCSRPMCSASAPDAPVKPGQSAADAAGVPKDIGPYRMPVAPLHQTCSRLLDTVRPLLADSQHKTATQLVDKFIEKGGIGERLQGLLEKRAEEKESWLSEWWQNYGYLDYRASVPINVSPGIVMKEQLFRDSNDHIDFTAKFLTGILRYKSRLDRGEVASDTMLGQAVCMSQYYKIFASCRRPHVGRDSIAQHDSEAARHIVVMHNNHLFLMPITDYKGLLPNHRQLRDQLHSIVNKSKETTAPPVGLMTGADRDSWAKASKNLLSDPINRGIVDCIERAAFVLCLDRPHAPPLEPEPLNSQPREPSDRYTTLARQMNYGGGSRSNSANRWFDKTLQIIIGSDGAFGASYEHTAAEGPPVVTMLDEAYDYVLTSPKDFEPCEEMEPSKKLDFLINETIEDDIKSSAISIDKQISRFELHAYTFRDFGKDSIKKLKMSPDAFIQVSLQLAYFRLHAAPCATYESGSLRRFRGGRTDVIRSCSSHSLAYAMTMVDPDANDSQRAEALRTAVAAHSKYSKDVVMGNGIDRHLLGLKLIAEENDIPLPDLFKHPVWTESTSWKLSTSQVASRSDSLLTFGAVVVDGYGFCYNPCGDHVNFMVSAWRQSRLTRVAPFAAEVQRALLDGRRILQTVALET